MRPTPAGCAAGLAALMLAAAAAGCSREPEPDAYGNVEAIEVVVGAEASGQLIAFDVSEGQRLAAGAAVGAIDRARLELEREQATAERAAHALRVTEIGQQVQALQAETDAARAQQAALEAQLDIAGRAYERTQRLYAKQAATAPQLDQAEREVRTLREQIKAQARQIAARAQQIDAARAQQQTARQQVAAADAQVQQAAERLSKTSIVNPVGGTVLTTYARTGEVVQVGQPLYTIANLQQVDVRAYVAQTQLAQIRLGQTAQITVDTGKAERRTVSGAVSWISSEAEFTPTPIQTREERADLVYAVKIRVANDDGLLKIGMPADVRFEPGTPR